jgi:alcohol dehydrogenase class IV
MLPSMIEFNGTQPLDDPKDASRRKAWVASLLNVTGTTTIEQSAAAVARFIRQLGGAASIDELSLPANYCTATHVASVNRQRLYNNPCRIDPNQRVVLLSTRSSQPITPIVDNCLSLDPT